VGSRRSYTLNTLTYLFGEISVYYFNIIFYYIQVVVSEYLFIVMLFACIQNMITTNIMLFTLYVGLPLFLIYIIIFIIRLFKKFDKSALEQYDSISEHNDNVNF
jgi:hypothetical protein